MKEHVLLRIHKVYLPESGLILIQHQYMWRHWQNSNRNMVLTKWKERKRTHRYTREPWWYIFSDRTGCTEPQQVIFKTFLSVDFARLYENWGRKKNFSISSICTTSHLCHISLNSKSLMMTRSPGHRSVYYVFFSLSDISSANLTRNHKLHIYLRTNSDGDRDDVEKTRLNNPLSVEVI